MLFRRCRRTTIRVVTIALVSLWWAILLTPHLPILPGQAQETNNQSLEVERTQTFPYPIQLVPGQSPCLVLDKVENNDNSLTPQEDYVRRTWNFPERWVWRQVCAGREANFYRLFFEALLLEDFFQAGNLPDEITLENLRSGETVVEAYRQYAPNIAAKKVRDYLRMKAVTLFENEQESALYRLYRSIRSNDLQANTPDAQSDDNPVTMPAISFDPQTFDLALIDSTGRLETINLLNSLFEPLRSTLDETITDILRADLQRPEELTFLRQYSAHISEGLGLSIDTLINSIKEEDRLLAEQITQIVYPDGRSEQQAEAVPDLSFSSEAMRLIISAKLREIFKNYYQQSIESYEAARSGDSAIDASVVESLYPLNMNDALLKTILLRDPFRSALPGRVVIRGGYFTENLDLSSAKIDQELRIEDSFFEGSVKFYKSTFARGLSFDGSVFEQDVLLNDASIQGNLFVRDISLRRGSDDSSAASAMLNLSSLQGQDILFGDRLATVIDLRLQHAASGQDAFVDWGFLHDPAIRVFPRVNLSNAHIGSFNVQTYSSQPILRRLSQSLNCPMQLDGFQYQQANEPGFQMLQDCLNMRYAHLAPATFQTVLLGAGDLPGNELDYASLLQPFEQAASAARLLGKYRVERDLLYQRKRLEVFVERIQSGRWTPNFITLTISDFLYGFGYHRAKAFRLFLLVWFIGALFACYQIIRKQNNLINDTLNKIKMEPILECSPHYTDAIAPVQVPARCTYRFLGSVSKVILNVNADLKAIAHGAANPKPETCALKTGLFLQFDYEFAFKKLADVCPQVNQPTHPGHQEGYVEITLHQTPGSAAPNDIDSETSITCLADTRHVNGLSDFIRSLDARDPHHDAVGFCHDLFPQSGQWALGTLTKSSDNRPEAIQLVNLREQQCEHRWYSLSLADQMPFLTGLFGTFAVLLAALLYLLPSVAVTSMAAVSPFFSVSMLQIGLILLLVLLFIGLVEVAHIPDRRWGRQVVNQAMMFSLDILLPVITLDDTLQRFVFDDSEGGARLFFLFQKLMAAVLASILLPIFFVTGL